MKVINLLELDRFDQLENLINNIKDFADIITVVLYVIVTLIVYFVAIMFIFVTVLGVFTSRILLCASRQIFYGLITTYVADPGAPEWVVKKENVIQLPIPAAVKTLSFEEMEKGGSMRNTLSEDAFKVTYEKLQKLIPKTCKYLKRLRRSRITRHLVNRLVFNK